MRSSSSLSAKNQVQFRSKLARARGGWTQAVLGPTLLGAGDSRLRRHGAVFAHSSLTLVGPPFLASCIDKAAVLLWVSRLDPESHGWLTLGRGVTQDTFGGIAVVELHLSFVVLGGMSDDPQQRSLKSELHRNHVNRAQGPCGKPMPPSRSIGKGIRQSVSSPLSNRDGPPSRIQWRERKRRQTHATASK